MLTLIKKKKAFYVNLKCCFLSNAQQTYISNAKAVFRCTGSPIDMQFKGDLYIYWWLYTPFRNICWMWVHMFFFLLTAPAVVESFPKFGVIVCSVRLVLLQYSFILSWQMNWNCNGGKNSPWGGCDYFLPNPFSTCWVWNKVVDQPTTYRKNNRGKSTYIMRGAKF